MRVLLTTGNVEVISATSFAVTLAGADISVDGALLCWRSSIAGASEFGATRDSHRVAADGSGWEPLRRGVQIRPLHVVGERISMLVRFEPGAMESPR